MTILLKPKIGRGLPKPGRDQSDHRIKGSWRLFLCFNATMTQYASSFIPFLFAYRHVCFMAVLISCFYSRYYAQTFSKCWGIYFQKPYFVMMYNVIIKFSLIVYMPIPQNLNAPILAICVVNEIICADLAMVIIFITFWPITFL